MKKFLTLLPFLALSLFTVVAQDNVIDEIIWVVGDEPILRSEVEGQRLQAQYDGVKFSGDPYCIIPEMIALQKLYLHQADLDSIIVNESDVISEVDRNINGIMNQLGSKEKMEEIFRMPLSKIREVRRDMARKQEVENRVKRQLVGNITVTPSEVRQYYKSLPLDSMPMTPSEVEVEIISVEPKISDEEVNAIKDRLRDFTERINKGDNFSTLAVMYSDDRESAKVGGELGFLGKGMLLPEFANVAFSLNDPKKISKIVQTEYGFHIIQLIEKRGDRINCRHILLKPKISATERNNALLRLDSIADQIRIGKVKFEEAAFYYSYDKDTKNNGGLMVNPSSGTPRFEMEQLPQEVGKLIYNMNIGEISKPFAYLNSKDKEVCAIIRLKSKTKAHRASLTDDFQKLKQIVQLKKSEQIINDWIIEKQKNTYVKINDGWRNCEFKYPGWIKE